MIRKVEAGSVCKQWLETLGNSTILRVTFIYVPGHAGVMGNERADRLASNASIEEGQPMDHADVTNNLRDVGRSEDFEGNDSLSLHRMKELGVRIGMARTKSHAGRRRRLVNQHRTGTVSRATLTELLKEGSEHLWTCPVCNEDD